MEEVRVAWLPEGLEPCALHVLEVSALAVRQLLGKGRQPLLKLLADALSDLVLGLL